MFISNEIDVFDATFPRRSQLIDTGTPKGGPLPLTNETVSVGSMRDVNDLLIDAHMHERAACGHFSLDSQAPKVRSRVAARKAIFKSDGCSDWGNRLMRFIFACDQERRS